MKVFLLIPNEKKRKATAAPDHAQVEGACPKCGVADFKVAGSGKYPSKDDLAWEAEGYCCACREHVGIIRVETNTLFGVREDEAVLRGRCRVY